jgi:hypothetical protein
MRWTPVVESGHPRVAREAHEDGHVVENCRLRMNAGRAEGGA